MTPPFPNPHALIARIATQLFDQPVIQNNFRAVYVEHMVCELLGDGWRVAGGNWAGWDLEGPGGARVEIKQAAARQTWDKAPKQRTRATFDIRPRTGYYHEGSDWIASPGRYAHVYVFCWHPEAGPDCDQRRADQWQFFVISTSALPATKTISLSTLTESQAPCNATTLRATVAAACRAAATRDDASSSGAAA